MLLQQRLLLLDFSLVSQKSDKKKQAFFFSCSFAGLCVTPFFPPIFLQRETPLIIIPSATFSRSKPLIESLEEAQE